MSYHRGGHSGAVAVSYSTMSPLSPTRRCPGNAGSGTSVISGTNGTVTSKYTNYRSSTPSNLGNDRNGGYYSSASNAGYRASSYTSSASSDTFRRTFYSPARSVSSYNESSSIVGASSISGSGLRYGSTSTSSASSSAGSSNSSCASRDRSTHQHHTPGSSAKTAAELYAIYSPTYYVPNIHGSKGSSGTSSNCRSSSSASSSGVSPSLNSELHGGDEYDSCRERRDRSYSSETSSGLGLTSNNTSTSSNNQNALLGSGNDRWSARREINKRRATPLIVTTSSSNKPITGNANKTDRTGSPTIEVTLEPVETSERSNDRFSEIGFRGHVDTESFHANPETPVSIEYPDYPKNVDINRDPDNNNVGNECASETRRRRVRRTCVEQSTANNLPSPSDEQRRRDVNDEGRTKTLERRHHDCDGNTDDSNDRERGVSKGDPRDKYRYDDHHHHHHQQQHHQHQHHHQRNRHGEQTSVNEASSRKNDLDIPNLSSCTDNTCNDDSTLSSVARSCCVTPSSPIVQAAIRSLSSLANPIVPSPTTPSVLEEEETLVQSEPTRSRPARLKSLEDTGKRDDTKIRGDSKDRDVVDDVGAEGDAGVGGGGGVVVVVVASSADADNHRKAFTRTKIPTNNDNTELLTNNNAQDREDHLGIGETTGRKIGNEATLVGTHDPSRSRDAREMLKGTRKSLLWTATNEIDDVNDDERVSKRDIDSRTNGDESVADVVNGFDNSNDQDHVNDSRAYELDENAGISGGYGRNGLRSTGNRSDDVDKGSISRRTLFGWNDPTINDITGASSSSSSFTSSNAASSSVAAAASSSNSTNSVPVAVHQNLYRGLNEQIDEGSNSRPPRSRLQSRRDERYGLNGLRNIGNTCFMNSVIQCLSNTRPLLEYLLNEQHLQDINTTTSSMKGALIKAFGQVIQELWEMSGDHVVNTTSLKSQIQRFAPRFMGYSQQDAQEFLRYLLEGLHEDVNRVTVKPQPILTDIPDHYSDSHKAAESWKRYLRSEDSTIVDVFVGQLRSSLLCTACDHVSVTLDPFWDLSLPIPMRLGTVKLNQCLEHFTKAETLDGDEKPTCSKCQMRRKCTKSFSIQKFPKILVIHLKRFSPTERFRGKLSVLVDFPLTGLDLSAFAAPGVQGCTYNLYGVANHSGTTYSGHYTAYCKHPYSGEWHEYNDSRVSTVPARSVVSSEAYVLFYEQQPPSPHL